MTISPERTKGGSKTPLVKQVRDVDARVGTGLGGTPSASGSLTGKEEEEENYDHFTREDQGRVKQRLELEKMRRQGMEERKRPENIVMEIGGVMGELAGGQEQGGVSCQRKEVSDKSRELTKFWEMRDRRYNELNYFLKQAIIKEMSIKYMEWLINEIVEEESILQGVIKLGQIVRYKMFNAITRQLRSLKKIRDEVWKCLKSRASPERDTHGRKQDSDSDWEDSEIAEQCPVIMLTKKEKEEREKDELQAPVQAVHVAMPLITEGQHTHYLPWGHTGVAGLIARLPILQHSASNFITRLESEMEETRLTLGDIKSLLSQILTKETTAAVLDRVDLGRLIGGSNG